MLFRSGLTDRSRRPHGSPRRIDEDTEKRIVELKGEHMYWGPKKIRALLRERYPDKIGRASCRERV